MESGGDEEQRYVRYVKVRHVLERDITHDACWEARTNVAQVIVKVRR